MTAGVLSYKDDNFRYISKSNALSKSAIDLTSFFLLLPSVTHGVTQQNNKKACGSAANINISPQVPMIVIKRIKCDETAGKQLEKRKCIYCTMLNFKCTKCAEMCMCMRQSVVGGKTTGEKNTFGNYKTVFGENRCYYLRLQRIPPSQLVRNIYLPSFIQTNVMLCYVCMLCVFSQGRRFGAKAVKRIHAYSLKMSKTGNRGCFGRWFEFAC